MGASNADIAQFKSQFKEFSSVGDAQVAAAYNITDVILDSSVWSSARDFAMARLQLTAHMLAMAIQGTMFAASGIGGGVLGLYMSSIRFGERDVSFGTRPTLGVASTAIGTLDVGELNLVDTMYGQTYLLLRNRNIVPVAIV
jgi:hypothetical protein